MHCTMYIWVPKVTMVHLTASGKGAVISNTNKHKLNIGSFMEGELVVTHDQMLDVLHTLYFIEA